MKTTPDRSDLAPRRQRRRRAGAASAATVAPLVEAATAADPVIPTEAATAADPVIPTEAATADSEPWALPFAAFRSGHGEICPFLRREGGADGIDLPLEHPDPANRCAAVGTPVPQSARQQELVCLRPGHRDCPRYLRGALVTTADTGRRGRVIPRRVVGAVAGLALASTTVLGLAVGGTNRALPGAGAPSTAAGDPAIAVAGSTATPKAAPMFVAAPVIGGAGTGLPFPPEAVDPSAAPVAIEAPTPATSPAPPALVENTPKAAPTSDRLRYLRACPGATGCYVYVVRPGDNLFSIAHWFGIAIDAVYGMNPSLRTSTLTPGMRIELPPPTR